MPFTPFHFGPALLIGFLAWKYLDFPTFVAASVIVDLRATLVFFDLLSGKLHGPMHTFAGAFLTAFVLSCMVYLLRDIRSWAMALFRLEQGFSVRKVLAAAFSGIFLHIVLDSILYADIRPFWPLQANPFLARGLYGEVYLFCLIGFAATLPLYLWRSGLYKNFVSK
ncbi:MAG: metal-dependent hydrolase [Candidatus Nanosalina sp.]